jgi:hypothetical protein
MASPKKECIALASPIQSKSDEAFEMIELAIDDIDLLTRAFSVIAEVCDEANGEPSHPLDKAPEFILH